MTKIYLVTSGQYSDYGVNAVFSTREKAEEFVKYGNSVDRWNDYRIEEWELDVPFEIPPGKKLYDVRIEKNGNNAHAYLCETPIAKPDHFVKGGWREASPEPMLFTSVWATDDKHAIKIANERRTQYLATESWGKI